MQTQEILRTQMQMVSEHMLTTKYLRGSFKSKEHLLTHMAETWEKDYQRLRPHTEFSKNATKFLDNRLGMQLWENSPNTNPTLTDFIEILQWYGCYEPRTKEEIVDLFNYFLPGGRIVSNYGRGHKRMSIVNCTGLDDIEDSMEGILKAQADYVSLMQSGAGVGLNLSTLRPKGDAVKGVDGYSSGPISFCRVFNEWGKTIESAGSRRGASIAILNVDHPDVQEFISCKEVRGTLTQFNISVGITQDFMDAYEADTDYDLTFNGEVYKTLPARQLMDEIIQHTYDHSEPGIIFLNTANKYNPLYFQETINLSNPWTTPLRGFKSA